MTGTFTESVVEDAALAWLASVGWWVRNGAEIAPGEPAAERSDYGLEQRLRDALARLKSGLPAEAWRTRSASSCDPKGRNSWRATGPCSACLWTA